MADKKATLYIGEATIELGVKSPTIGTDVIDVSTLGSKGYFTFDPGFTSTASCESKITFIDGDKGILLHRGYPIDQLAKILLIWKFATSCYTAKRQPQKSMKLSKQQSHATP